MVSKSNVLLVLVTALAVTVLSGCERATTRIEPDAAQSAFEFWTGTDVITGVTCGDRTTVRPSTFESYCTVTGSSRGGNRAVTSYRVVSFYGDKKAMATSFLGDRTILTCLYDKVGPNWVRDECPVRR